MSLKKFLCLTLTINVIIGCSNNDHHRKGFQVNNSYVETSAVPKDGLNRDSLIIEVKPTSVLLTGINDVRLTTIYKLNYEKDGKSSFTGSNSFHFKYQNDENMAYLTGDNWNNHLIPGLEAVYGYNMVNISHYSLSEKKEVKFFEKPVLIKTLYYPSFSKDTLNFKPITRDYFIITVYDEDTNKDGYINPEDLRRIYLFDIHGHKVQSLVPMEYSVFKSGYDPANDLMFIFAQMDTNGNGKRDSNEPISVFWIDLKKPQLTDKMY